MIRTQIRANVTPALWVWSACWRDGRWKKHIRNGQCHATSWVPTLQNYRNCFLESVLVDIQHGIQHSRIIMRRN